jgi:serine O-acetyltransferase
MTRASSAASELAPVVDALCRDALALAGGRVHAAHDASGCHGVARGRLQLPTREAVGACVEGLRAVFFPGYFGPLELDADRLRYAIGATLDRALQDLQVQIERAITFASSDAVVDAKDASGHAHTVVSQFLQRLPAVRALVASDVDAAYEGDPALTSRDEAILSYPGILAVTYQRIAHELYVLQVPLIPRMITEHAHSLTGIDIHPGAQIGERFFIDHGTGVVVGETAVIGRNVRLYQGVTLGAKSFPLDAQGNPIKGIPRHPILEDDVVIYSGATVLGRITVGKGSSIGGNVWLTHGVPAGSRISQAVVRDGRFEQGGGI